MKTLSYKHILGFLFPVFLLPACTNDELDINEQKPATGQETVQENGTVTGCNAELAINEGEEDMDTGVDMPATRMNLVDGVQKWELGDRVSMYRGSTRQCAPYEVTEIRDGNYYFTTQPDDKGDTYSLLENVGDNEHFYAIYPERSVSAAGTRGAWVRSNDSTKVSCLLFAEQHYAENMNKRCPAPENKNDKRYTNNFGAYMVADAQVQMVNETPTVTFHFNTLMSIIDVNLNGMGLAPGVYPKSVTLKSNNGASLVGKVTWDFTANQATVSTNDATPYAASSQCDVVKVDSLPNTWTWSTEGEKVGEEDYIVRFYVLPVKLEDGVTVTVETSDNYSYAKSSTSKIGTGDATTTFSGVKKSKNENAETCHPFYKKLNFGAVMDEDNNPKARIGDWMAGLPSDIFLSLLSIPGAHNAASSSISETDYPQAHTQDLTIRQLLDKGCRALGLRVGRDADLHLMLGNINTGISLSDALNAISGFLAQHPTETVFVRLHREDPDETTGGSQTQQESWGRIVYGELKAFQTIETRAKRGGLLTNLTANTTLGDCRGKIVIVSCDEIYDGWEAKPENQGFVEAYYGAKAPQWASNCAATIKMQNGADITSDDMYLTYQDIGQYGGIESLTAISCEDRYRNIFQRGGITSDAQKVTIVRRTIDEAIESSGQSEEENKRLFINYCSWNGQAGTSARANAKAIMPQINSFIEKRYGRLGIIMTDFFRVDYPEENDYQGTQFVGLVVQQNFKYVFEQRTRINHRKGYTTPTPENSGLVVYPKDPADSHNPALAPAYRGK